MEYEMHVERLDGTIVDVPSNLDIKYPHQQNAFAERLAYGDPYPQVYISVWKNANGEIRTTKYHSDACWDLETFALEMFEKMCKEHDWYYDYSDDHNVWTRGRDSASRLKSKYAKMVAKYPEAAKAIWDAHCPFNKQES